MAEFALTVAEDNGVWKRWTGTVTVADTGSVPIGIGAFERVVFYQTANQGGTGTAFTSLVPIGCLANGTALIGWVAAVQNAGYKLNASAAASVASAKPGFLLRSGLGPLMLRVAGTGGDTTRTVPIEVIGFYRNG